MRRGTVYLFMGMHVLFAAATYVLGRHAARGFGSPAALTLARALGSSVLLASLFGTLIPRPRFPPRDWAKVAALGILLVPLNQYFFLIGLKDTVPGHPAVIYAMTPVGVLLLQSALDRRRPGRAKILGVLAAFAGVLIVLRPWVLGPQFREIRRGDLWILLGLLIWVVYTVAARPLLRRHDARTVTAWSMILGTLVLLPSAAGPLARTDFAAVPAEAWIGLAWLAAVTSTVMMLLWNRMLRHLEPVEVAICANAQPAATALLAWTLAVLGVEAPAESLDLGPLYWLGTALVIVGVTLVQRRPRAPLAPPVPE
ncbi:MAG TPA: DMT family transporter [Planctomycetota bacterium]|nr:DMT family transporter [Planctomycetota bacterium]